jgi:putative Mg2+ transporter-C (MgtC) family protein
LNNKDTISGTASAASIWNTGAIGLAAACSRFEVALVLSLLNFITLRLVGSLKNKMDLDDDPNGE